MTALLVLLTASTSWLASPAAAQPDTLRATLDLRGPIEAGWLDPASETVGLRGSVAPLSWNATLPAADPDGDGVYTVAAPVSVEVDSLVLAYKIKVDGTGNPNEGWQEGADHTIVLRPGQDAEIALAWDDRAPEAPPLLTGRIDTIEGVAGEGLAPRDVYVWLPPGYDADPDRRYPVLYLHDGRVKFGVDGGAEWGMDEAATELIEAGEIEPLILVAVSNTDRRTDEYTPTRQAWERVAPRTRPPTASGPLGPLTGTYAAEADSLVVALRDGVLMLDPPEVETWIPIEPDADGAYPVPGTDATLTFPENPDGSVNRVVARRPSAGGLGDAYGRLLTDTIKPLVDRRYRTLPDAAHTGVGGSSLGGLISMHLGLTRPDVFGRLLVASPSVWWDDRVLLAAVAEAEPRPEQRVWVDIGTREGDAMVPDARRLAALLVERGWDAARVRYVEAEGAGHETSAWAARAPDMLRFLFPPEADE